MTDRRLVGAATFISLSYARPQNIQRIVDTILQAQSCGRLLLSNNNPDIDIRAHLDRATERLTVLQQTEHWPAVKRFCLAREEAGDYFVCIDDDLFLTVEQIDGLVARLIAEPAVPHGIWGANVRFRRNAQGGDVVLLQGGLRNIEAPVRIINRTYAFTAAHVQRFFELLALLGIEDPRALGPADDIVLSFSGTGAPLVHDLGPLEDCPTADLPGVAVWQEPGFFDRRSEKLFQLRLLFGES